MVVVEAQRRAPSGQRRMIKCKEHVDRRPALPQGAGGRDRDLRGGWRCDQAHADGVAHRPAQARVGPDVIVEVRSGAMGGILEREGRAVNKQGQIVNRIADSADIEDQFVIVCVQGDFTDGARGSVRELIAREHVRLAAFLVQLGAVAAQSKTELLHRQYRRPDRGRGLGRPGDRDPLAALRSHDHPPSIFLLLCPRPYRRHEADAHLRIVGRSVLEAGDVVRVSGLRREPLAHGAVGVLPHAGPRLLPPDEVVDAPVRARVRVEPGQGQHAVAVEGPQAGGVQGCHVGAAGADVGFRDGHEPRVVGVGGRDIVVDGKDRQGGQGGQRHQ